MKITALKEQVKDQNRVSIFVDEKYSFSLTLQQVLDYKLKVGYQLDVQLIAELKKQSDEGKLYSMVLDWLMRRPHSTKEYKDYMYKKKAAPELTELFLQKLQSRGYINDEHFAEWWAKGRLVKNKSLRTITSELRAKGIESATITAVLALVAEETDEGEFSSDRAALIAVVQKLKDRPRYADKNKFIRYLSGKGFRYDDIKDILTNNERN